MKYFKSILGSLMALTMIMALGVALVPAAARADDIPATPVLISPKGEAKLPNDRVTFEWVNPANTPVNHYQISIDQMPLKIWIGGTSYTANLADGLHTWSVRAFNSKGEASAWSTRRGFTSGYDLNLMVGGIDDNKADSIDRSGIVAGAQAEADEDEDNDASESAADDTSGTTAGASDTSTESDEGTSEESENSLPAAGIPALLTIMTSALGAAYTIKR